MKLIIRYCKPYALKMLFGFFIKMLGTFADLMIPWVLSFILDEVVPKGEIKEVLLFGGLMLLLAIAARWLNISANRRASAVAKHVTGEVRHDLFVKTMELSGSQTDSFHIPSLISRMTSDTYNIHQFVGMMQRLGVRAPLILIGGVFITLTMEPVLTLILVVLIPILAVLIVLISKSGIPLFKKAQSCMDTMVRIMRENITGIRVVKALSKTEYEKERFAKTNSEMIHREMKAGTVMALSGPVMSFLLNLGLTLVVVVGAFRVNEGASEPGVLVAFLSYFMMILNAVLMVNRIFVNASKATASANRIDEVLMTQKDYVVEEKTEMKNPAKVPHIEFRDVTFSYNRKGDLVEQAVLRNISFTLRHGESLGIIGATGSGKTTLINLLMRFYEISKGEILIDGRNIREFTPEELRTSFGVVFQNDVVFADTIRENISFSRELRDEEILAAAEYAEAKGFIEEKEEGFLHKAAIKGADLSGGQKQRLLVARALAGNPKILILDDSSSALDYKTDSVIRKNIREHYASTTTIMVAQRASSVMHMTNILVLEEGEMIGYGTHESLLQNCPVYKEIAELQMGDIE